MSFKNHSVYSSVPISVRSSVRSSVHKSNAKLIELNQMQKETFINIEKQLQNLPNDITKLQTLLKPLLNNIFIEKYLKYQSPINFNIADTTKNYNIYTIPATQENLDLDKYRIFLKFMIEKLFVNNTEFSNDEGNIITAYCINDEDKTEIEKIKIRYEQTYLPKIFRPPAQKYPEWVDDLLNKNRNVLYEESEKEYNFKNILNQDDNDFILTLKNRIDGLQKCSTDIKEKKKKNTKKKKYFKKKNEIKQKI